MAIGIDVSIYAKTELLLSPQGARIVAGVGAEQVMFRTVTVPARGANCSSQLELDKALLERVTVPARGANCSYNYAGIQCKGHLFSGYFYTIFHLIFYIVVQNP